MPDNFDWPPATGSNSSSNESAESPHYFTNVTSRLQHLRDLINSDMSRDRTATQRARAMDALDQELEEMDAEPLSRRLQRRRTRLSEQESQTPVRPSRYSGREIASLGATESISLSDSRSGEAYALDNRSRRQMIRPSEILARQRQQMHVTSAATLQGLQQVAQRLSEAESSVHALLDEAVPHLRSPLMIGQDRTDGSRRWSAKRQKLDCHDSREGHQVMYGHFGQVAAGQLKMEVHTCDGGTYSDDGERSWPENVLLNDDSVYCTKTNRCNLILQHRGQGPFNVSRLVIKAPGSGFDAPVQGGMIFVSMTCEDLIARTAGFQIRVWPRPRTRTRHHPHDNSTALQTNLDDSRSYRGSFEWNGATEEPLVASETDDAEWLNLLAGREISNGHRISLSYDDGDGGEAEYCGSGGTDGNESFDSYLADVPAFLLQSFWQDSTRRDPSGSQGRQESTEELSDCEEVDSVETFDRLRPQIFASRPRDPISSETAVASSDASMLQPHALFLIKTDKSMVNIMIDPPVAGRFILLKLWSSDSAGNVDIQNVTVHGFAGPRFFPSLQLR